MNCKWLLVLGVLAFVACGSKDKVEKKSADQDTDTSTQVAKADAERIMEGANIDKAAEDTKIEMAVDDVDVAKATEVDPAEALTALNEKYDTAMSEFRKAYGAASEAERQQIVADQYPKPDEYADQFMKLAEENPDHPAAVEALLWVAQRSRGAKADEAMDILFEKHGDSPEMSQLCFSLMYGPAGGKSQQRLEKLMKDSPHHEVQGLATFCLATCLQRNNKDGTNADEYVALFKTVIDDYGDVEIRERNIAKMASGAIFEIENLAVGKVAPDIEAEDLDGVSFKLSDYRGKVVMLDFWGDW